MSGYVIPFFGLKRQYENIKDELLDITDKVLRSGQLIEGFYTLELEKYLGERVGSYAITCHSGTQALEIVATYLRQSLDTPNVALPNLTYPASGNAFLTTGYKLHLVDTNNYGIIKTDDIKSLVDVTVLVGLYGRDPQLSFKTKINSNFVIVDGAQHWLCLNKNSNLGLATTVSFDPTKNLNSSGNGGAILTHDIELLEFARFYRSNGKPTFKMPGTNSKMSELDCAHVLVRSKYVDDWQNKRLKIASFYNQEFSQLPIRLLCDLSVPNAIQKYVIFSNERKELQLYLHENNIETKIAYENTLSELPAFKGYSNPSFLSVSCMLSKGVLSLPIYPELKDIEIEYVVNAVKKFYK